MKKRFFLLTAMAAVLFSGCQQQDDFRGSQDESFDIKQMICHLLGIATAILNGTLENKKLSFIYLHYDPTKLAIDSNAKSIIDSIYERTGSECNQINWSDLFRIILEFLAYNKFSGVKTYEEIDEAVRNFSFNLVSQNTYSAYLKTSYK